MKKEYTKPELVIHGDLATYTQHAGCHNRDGLGNTPNNTAYPAASGACETH